MSSYEIPSWAGKPATGLHLDVMKESKLVQKLMIDQKRCYLFGRNSQLNDFCIDHQSCSRVHAALVYHKSLNRAFLVDLGSTHGTFIGHIRLEAHKPTPLPIDSCFHFGASTRNYMIRERPQAGPRPIMDELEKSTDNAASDGTLLGLPETETEMENLTEFNTAHNRRITTLGIGEDKASASSAGSSGGKKKRKIRITFNEEEDIINPEDVDPSVGRFRNMVESTIIPKKRTYSGGPGLLGTPLTPSSSSSSSTSPLKKSPTSPGGPNPTSPGGGVRGLYDGLDSGSGGLFSLGLPLPNPAPEIEMMPPPPPASTSAEASAAAAATSAAMMEQQMQLMEDPNAPKKKKYAKEAWPGRKHVPSLLV